MLINRRFTQISVEVTTLHTDDPHFVITWFNPRNPEDTFTCVLTAQEAYTLADALAQAGAEHRQSQRLPTEIVELNPKKGTSDGHNHSP